MTKNIIKSDDESEKLNIETLREQISTLDKEGINYLKKRLELSEKVAKVKLETKAPVYDSKREMIVTGDALKEFPDEMKHKIESVISTVMRISRELQYEKIYETDEDCKIKDIISTAGKKFKTPKTIACQGTSGSYSHIAAGRIFPLAVKIPTLTFEECIEKVKSGDCETALLPLENTTAGTVNDVYNLITSNSLYIIKAVTIPIHHKLIILPGAKIQNVRTVISHPQALAQCSEFIRKMGWNKISVDNTAFAARKMVELGDPTYCAIASGEAGDINNLRVLNEDVCDFEHNQTRFVAISKNFEMEKHASRISVYFRTAHQSGSLAYVLNILAERGLNMTKIQSRPVGDTPWEYGFWVDIEASQKDENVYLALYQLSKELPFLQLLGWYEDCKSTGEIV